MNIKTPYRSHNKIKALHYLENGQNLSSTDIYYNGIIPQNNFNVKQQKKDYSLKAVSVPYHWIGDLFFPQGRNGPVILLLININSRYSVAYHLGVEQLDLKYINGKIQYVSSTKNKDVKSSASLIDAFNKLIKTIKITHLSFDNERGIVSDEFQRYLQSKNIKFCSILPNQHTSLGLIDRLSATLRNISYNLQVPISNQKILDEVLFYYNNAPHKTLTKVIFSSEPRLKLIYNHGITPYQCYNIEKLQAIFVRECLKYNMLNKDKYDNLIGRYCRLYQKAGTNFKKNSALVTRDFYIITKKIGNIFECTNVNNEDDKVNVPRWMIQVLN